MKNNLYLLILLLFAIPSTTKAQSCGPTPQLGATASCNDATLYWSLDSNATMYEYQLDSAGVTVANGFSTNYQILVPGLTANTLYIASVRALCPSDTTAFTAFTFITPACQQCPRPGAITAAVVNCDSLVFGWNPPGGNVGFQDYQYSVTLNPMQPNWVTTPTTPTIKSVGGLLPDTVYHIQVRTNCVTIGLSNVRTLVVHTPPCNLSISPSLKRPMLQVYPNPVQSQLNFVLNHVNNHSVLEVMTMDGKILSHSRPTQTHSRLDFSAYPQGLYFIRYSDGEKYVYKKVVKH